MKKVKTEELLNRMSRGAFIEFFEVFRKYYCDDSNAEIIERFKDKDWSYKAKCTRATVGKRIFKEERVIEALEITISGKRISPELINRAEELLKNYTLE